MQHFGTWKENFIIIWLTLKTSFLLALKKIKKYWMKNKNWHPKILSWYLEVANCQFFCICKTWIRNWGYWSKDHTSSETSQFLRFSLKEQKSLKHFWPLAAIYCKIPWNPVTYRVTIKEWPPKEWISKKSTLFTFFCSFERKGWPKQTKSTLFYHHGYGNIKHKHLICCKMPISIVIGEKIMDTNFSSILYKMSIKTC